MIDLDLDLFAPKDRVVKFGGKMITVKQPTTEQLFQIMTIGQRMSTFDTENVSNDDLETLLKESRAIIAITIPELVDAELNIQQIVALVQMIGEMALPKDLKELQSRGITADIDPKATATS